MRKCILTVLGTFVAIIIALSVSTGLGQAACVSGDIAGPPRITDLGRLALAKNGVTLKFTSPTDQSGIGKYEFKYRQGSALTALNWASSPGGQTPFNTSAFPENGKPQYAKWSGLTAGKLYYFAIKAYDSCGNASGMSNILSFTTPLIENNEVVVFWDAIPDKVSYTVGISQVSRDNPGFVEYSETCVNTTKTDCKIVLNPGVTYFISTKGHFADGRSGLWGNEASVSLQ